MSASAARLKHFGWGREGEGLSADEEAFVLARAEARFGTALTESASAPLLDEIALARPRIAAPVSLPFCTERGTTTARRTPTASRTPSSRAALRATMRARRTSSPIRAMKATSPPCSTGPDRPTRP